MKNTIKITLAAISSLILAGLLLGCSKTDKIADYAPVKHDASYHYVGEDEYSSYDVFVMYDDKGSYQWRVDTNSSSVVQVMTVKNGEMRLTLSKAQAYGFGSFLGEKSTTDTLLLKEPLKKGTSWVQREAADGAVNCSITAVDKEITVPLGTYKALEVTATYPDGTTILYYYAKDVGLIKTEYNQLRYASDQSGSVIGEIDEIRAYSDLAAVGNGPYVGSLAAFYPDATGRITYETVEISLPTNADANKIFMDELRKAYADKPITLSNGTKLTKVEPSYADWQMTVTFSDGFADDMKNSLCGEADAFKSVISSLAYYYDLFYVKVMTGGGAYVPDGVDVDENGYFTATTINNYDE